MIQCRKLKRTVLIVCAFVICISLLRSNLIEWQSTRRGKIHPKSRSNARDYIDDKIHDGFDVHEFDDKHRVLSETEDQPVKPTVFLGNYTRLKTLHNECVPLDTWVGATPICIYDPAEDQMISSFIKDKGTWEEHLLNATTEILLSNPNLTFIDFGCNIGAYTITAAKLGRRVFSVDIMEDSLTLLKHSLDLGHIRQNVTLIKNAVSDTRGPFRVNVVRHNIGGSHIKEIDGQRPGPENSETVQSILLDDILTLNIPRDVFVKMDIEGTEVRAFKGGKDFFNKLNVKFFLMEWMLYRNKPRAAQSIIHFLLSNGMLPYMDHKQSIPLRHGGYIYWPDNVFWIKR